MNIAYEPYAGASDVFAKTQTTFTAQSIAKRTPAKDQARQSHFNGQLRRLTKAFGGVDIPVFRAFKASGFAWTRAVWAMLSPPAF